MSRSRPAGGIGDRYGHCIHGIVIPGILEPAEEDVDRSAGSAHFSVAGDKGGAAAGAAAHGEADAHTDHARAVLEVAGGAEQCPLAVSARLAAFVATRRRKAEVTPTPPSMVGTLPLDPRMGAVISSIVAAAPCIKPRGMLTSRQVEKVDVLKQALPIFACMQLLTMRFRGLLRGHDTNALDNWIRDAMGYGIHVMQKFAAKLRYDIDAVHNAIREPWSNGQTEGQINRLKMLK